MKYIDGQLARPGDLILIDGEYRGRVVACMDSGAHLPAYEGWDHLISGILVDTDFAGLVHYTQSTGNSEALTLLQRHVGK